MGSASKGFTRVVFIIYLALLHGALIYFAADKIARDYFHQSVPSAAVPDPVGFEPVPTPIQEPSIFYDANRTETNTATPTPAPTTARAGQLLIPVAGVTPQQLVDSFSDARSEGRVHDAIDIPAPAGTPVLAADDGEIVKFFDSEKGGITIYQLSSDRKFVYYYAHLQRRADNLQVGQTVERGRTIGYVGDTGNAGSGNFHLHFSVAAVSDPKRYWEGVNINPYPLLRGNANGK